ncbi:prephenate dehydratase [Methanoregula sp.]|uniref:prephenate dehydratase n=1 Tax=Methanoregula sp. TaxID=2052170 RepID=UPI002B576C3D|nr:prephenate dehydratase domain-containing protein [Methanoregula sp.]HVP95910.1 prephenate dehydratase domain-containing protein [Methanoregula sp.]
MTVITLGPEGTFSHELALRLKSDTIVLEPTIHSIFASVAAENGDGIVPIENSEAGGVGETLDGLLRYSLFITGEMYMPIHHNLASLVPRDKIRVIYAHPQTHEQCSGFLEIMEVPVIHTSSNAASAIEAKKTPNAGAILSVSAAAIYHMPVIVEHVENNPENTTRFVRIAKHPGPGCRSGKCSILIDPDTDRAGLLYDLLGVFAKRKINLTRIESRPSKRGMGKYVFFLDYAISGPADEALRELEAITAVRNLGCYPRIGVPP